MEAASKKELVAVSWKRIGLLQNKIGAFGEEGKVVMFQDLERIEREWIKVVRKRKGKRGMREKMKLSESN